MDDDDLDVQSIVRHLRKAREDFDKMRQSTEEALADQQLTLWARRSFERDLRRASKLLEIITPDLLKRADPQELEQALAALKSTHLN